MDTLSRYLRVLDRDFLGNSWRDYLICAVAILLGIVLVKIFQKLVMRRLKAWSASTPSPWDDLILESLESNAVPALYVLVIWMGLRDLYMKEMLHQAVRVAAALAITFLCLRVALTLTNQGIRSYFLRHGGERTQAKEKGLQGIVTLAKFVLLILAAILVLDNLGFKISAFMAGLGVTGIAVALAAQTILGDLFGYFVIFFDEPFEVGHAIKVDNFTGEVEHIGLKTTRLRGAEGEQIIFSNKFLTDSRIQNYKRMVRRRVTFSFELERTASAEVLRGIPDRVKGFLDIPDVTFERTHFVSFGETGPRFEVSYVVETADFARHLEIRQNLNLSLYTFFQNEGVNLAFPSRMVYLKREEGETSMRPPSDAAPGKKYP